MKRPPRWMKSAYAPVPAPFQTLFFYRNMVIPRRPHTPDEFALEMKVDFEGLRMEIILSQPASSQCHPSPRRAAVDTGSEEQSHDGRPRSVRSQDSVYRNLKHQRRRKDISLLKPAWMVFCTPKPRAGVYFAQIRHLSRRQRRDNSF